MASANPTAVQKEVNRRKSCDTVCSSNSSCFLQKRKPVHPLASSVRSIGRSGGSVGQRVFSAKLLRVRTLQNQLNDANFHLAELSKENRVLKTLQKRQDKALAKYEGENADLPKILKTYEGEIHCLQEKNKTLRKTVRELCEQLKTREDELLNVKEQLKRLINLTKDKNLKEREKLTEEVEQLRDSLKKSEEQVSMLNRKLMLENKTCQYKLNMEMNKHKQCQRELKGALAEIEKFGLSSEQRIKSIAASHRRFANIPQRQAISMISLEPKSFLKNSLMQNGNPKENNVEKNSSQELLKLEPIPAKNGFANTSSSLNDILKPPSATVKARLSISSSKDFDEISAEIEKLQLINNYDDDTDLQKSIYTVSSQNLRRSRPTSTQKLQKLEPASKLKMEPQEMLKAEEILGDYYNTVVHSVQSCNETITFHKETLEQSKLDTEKLVKKLEETDKINSKLRKSNFSLEEDELLSAILKEEYLFQHQDGKKLNGSITDRNGNITRKDEPKVAMEDKRKLLETLKAIDNGESVEVPIPEKASKKGRLIQELFGDVDN